MITLYGEQTPKESSKKEKHSRNIAYYSKIVDEAKKEGDSSTKYDPSAGKQDEQKEKGIDINETLQEVMRILQNKSDEREDYGLLLEYEETKDSTNRREDIEEVIKEIRQEAAVLRMDGKGDKLPQYPKKSDDPETIKEKTDNVNRYISALREHVKRLGSYKKARQTDYDALVTKTEYLENQIETTRQQLSDKKEELRKVENDVENELRNRENYNTQKQALELIVKKLEKERDDKGSLEKMKETERKKMKEYTTLVRQSEVYDIQIERYKVIEAELESLVNDGQTNLGKKVVKVAAVGLLAIGAIICASSGLLWYNSRDNNGENTGADASSKRINSEKDTEKPTIEARIEAPETNGPLYLFRVKQPITITYAAEDNKGVFLIEGHTLNVQTGKREKIDEEFPVPEAWFFSRKSEEKKSITFSTPGTYTLELAVQDKEGNRTSVTLNNIIIEPDTDSMLSKQDIDSTKNILLKTSPAEKDLVICTTPDNKTGIFVGPFYYEIKQDKNEADLTKIVTCDGDTQTFPSDVPVHLSYIDIKRTKKRQTETGVDNLFVLREREQDGVIEQAKIVPEELNVKYCLTIRSKNNAKQKQKCDPKNDTSWKNASVDDGKKKNVSNEKMIEWSYKEDQIEIIVETKTEGEKHE